jgi:rRNA maturation endonuclease Nob1
MTAKVMLVLDNANEAFISFFIEGSVPRVGDIVEYEYRETANEAKEYDASRLQAKKDAQGMYKVVQVQHRYVETADNTVREHIFLFVEAVE